MGARMRPGSAGAATMRRRSARASVALLLVSAMVLGCAADSGARAAAEPRLVLLLAIDQLRPDRLGPEKPGGLGRLWREGRRFEDAALEHANTDTCPGHVSMVTGRHPGPSGIPGNRLVDPVAMQGVYCVADSAETAPVLGRAAPGGAHDGRSPRRIRVSTFGDWLKAKHPDSRVYAVSGKDRSAIALAGHGADAAYWIDSSVTGAFTTSGFYREQLPDWVAAWGPERLLAGVPERWVIDPAVLAAIEDDRSGESDRYGRTSPHPLSDVRAEGIGRVAPLLGSPYADAQTLAFARELIEREGLGADAVPDYLGLALSATDYIGHLYGPHSAESADALARLDADLARFFAFLDERIGWANVLVVLTADHGVLPLPEQIPASERQCAVASGRIPAAELDAGLVAHLDAAIAGETGKDSGAWFVRERHAYVFDRRRAAAAGVPVARLAELAGAYLTAQPGIQRVWRGDRLAAQAATDPTARLFLNSQAPGHEADLFIDLEPTCLLSSYPSGTSHGSAHLYDRRVPLIFVGAGIQAGSVPGRAATIDIAPTLADRLGLVPGPELDGRVLPLAAD